MRIISPKDPGFACTPNKTFRFDCNTCTCNADGAGANCTENPCQTASTDKFTLKDKTDAATTTEIPSDTCVPGKRWKNDCNWCYCTETGISLCTLRGCLTKADLPTVQIDINQVKKKRQAIDKYHPTSGVEVIYTLEDLNDPNFSCTPSLSFKVDCNTCWCAADGKRARFCTRIGCTTKSPITETPAAAESSSTKKFETIRGF